ncbi:MAG: hypothetical protein ACPLPR_02405 [Bacillota bacterium]
MFKIWTSTEMAANWLTQNTILSGRKHEVAFLAASDAANPGQFHRMPDHIKKILYLDAPDVILEQDGEPVLAIELSREAGTGHNVFQRFARIAASAENGVPVVYIYPEAVWISREASSRWDPINPLIFRAMERLMHIFSVPALLYYYPSHYRFGQPPTTPRGLVDDPSFPGLPDSADPEMKEFFAFVNELVETCSKGGPHLARTLLQRSRLVINRMSWMQDEYHRKGGNSRSWSPLSACQELPTRVVEEYLAQFAGVHTVSLPGKRAQTIVYQVGGDIRADPYTGSLAAVDYLLCRLGRNYEDRDKNLAVAWGKVKEGKGAICIQGSHGIDEFIAKVKSVTGSNRCLLGRAYQDLEGAAIPRYYMQARYGCTFTKPKEIRIYCYFADALLFRDGALWREA